MVKALSFKGDSCNYLSVGNKTKNFTKPNFQKSFPTVNFRPKFEAPKDSLTSLDNKMYMNILKFAPAKNIDEVVKYTGLKKDFVKDIIRFEGFENHAYYDTAGHLTIGCGHNIDADRSYNLGRTINNAQVYTLLKNDL